MRNYFFPVFFLYCGSWVNGPSFPPPPPHTKLLLPATPTQKNQFVQKRDLYSLQASKCARFMTLAHNFSFIRYTISHIITTEDNRKHYLIVSLAVLLCLFAMPFFNGCLPYNYSLIIRNIISLLSFSILSVIRYCHLLSMRRNPYLGAESMPLRAAPALVIPTRIGSPVVFNTS